MSGERPCGACGALVPADTGCPHWDPAKVRKPRRARVQITADNRAAIDELTRQMKGGRT